MNDTTKSDADNDEAAAKDGGDSAASVVDSSEVTARESRFKGNEEPTQNESKKRNLKNKKIMNSLDSELDEFNDIFEASDEAQSNRKGRKKRRKKGRLPKKQQKAQPNAIKKFQTPAIILAVLVVVGYGYYLMNQPYVGTIGYGMCKVFLERWIEFPDTLKISDVIQKRD